MDRSVAFVIGGVLLCVGGYLIEVLRRRLLARLGRADAGGEGA